MLVQIISIETFLEMGHPNLSVELKRGLKTGVKDFYTYTRTPPVYFLREKFG